MTAFIIITTIILILLASATVYYERRQTKAETPKVTKARTELERPTSAIRIENSSGIVMRGNKSYGYDHLADITDSGDVYASDNEARR